MHPRRLALLLVSGLILLLGGAKQTVSVFMHGVLPGGIALTHSGQISQAFANGEHAGYVFGSWVGIALRLFCGIALLVMCWHSRRKPV